MKTQNKIINGKHKIVLIILVILVISVFLFSSITGYFINTPDSFNEISAIEKTSSVNEVINEEDYSLANNESSENAVEIEILSTKFINEIDLETGEQKDKLIVEGFLINNLNGNLTNFEAQARFYNELSREDSFISLNGQTDPFKIRASNQYININKFLSSDKSSITPFQNGLTKFKLIFDNIPHHNSKRDYLSKALMKNMDWIEGNYDIDSVDLIIYHDKKELKRISLEMPQKYISDITLDINGMHWINRGGHRTSLDSLSFTVENKEQNKMSEPKIILTAYDLETKEQFVDITINIPNKKIVEPVNFIRLVPEQDFFMKFNKETLNHILFLDLYDGKDFIDRNYFILKCNERELTDTLSYFPCLDFVPWAYLDEESDISIEIIEMFKGVKGDDYSGIEIFVKNKGDIIMQNPVVEIYCGNSWVYNFDNSQIGKYLSLDFRAGAFCLEPSVLLREKYSSIAYAKDTYELHEQD